MELLKLARLTLIDAESLVVNLLSFCFKWLFVPWSYLILDSNKLISSEFISVIYLSSSACKDFSLLSLSLRLAISNSSFLILSSSSIPMSVCDSLLSYLQVLLVNLSGVPPCVCAFYALSYSFSYEFLCSISLPDRVSIYLLAPHPPSNTLPASEIKYCTLLKHSKNA